MMDDDQTQPKYYEQLSNSGFKQNTCWAWRPKNSPFRTAIVFFTFGLLFLAVGLMLFFVSQDAVEYSGCYAKGEKAEEIKIVLKEELQPPIHVYYEITNLYQNHRRFASSVSNDQLYKEYVNDTGAAQSCYPVITEDDRAKNGLKNVSNPCGLLPKFYFNGNCGVTCRCV